METFSIALLPDDDMVVTLVRSAAGYSSRDVPEEGCLFLFVDRTSCICLTTLICMGCSKMLT